MTAMLERLRAFGRTSKDRLEDRRRSSTVIGVTFDAFGEEFRAGGPVLSGAIAFRVFMFFAPFIALVVIVSGFVADVFDRDPRELIQGNGIAALTATGIDSSRDISKGARVTALIVVTYAVMMGARSFVTVLRVVHSLIWREPPAAARHGARSALVLIGSMIVFTLVSTGIVALWHLSVISGVLALLLFMVTAFAVWFAVTWWLPHGNSDRLGLIPGVALFAVGTQLLHALTVLWFPHLMRSKSELYGALGGALVLLLWAYLTGRLITLAASLNAAVYRRRDSAPPGAPPLLARIPFVGPANRRVWAWLVDRG
jgi:uncharacterized BrkB/YihY/UPF0761 family membrane protein